MYSSGNFLEEDKIEDVIRLEDICGLQRDLLCIISSIYFKIAFNCSKIPLQMNKHLGDNIKMCSRRIPPDAPCSPCEHCVATELKYPHTHFCGTAYKKKCMPCQLGHKWKGYASFPMEKLVFFGVTLITLMHGLRFNSELYNEEEHHGQLRSSLTPEMEWLVVAALLLKQLPGWTRQCSAGSSHTLPDF